MKTEELTRHDFPIISAAIFCGLGLFCLCIGIAAVQFAVWQKISLEIFGMYTFLYGIFNFSMCQETFLKFTRDTNSKKESV